MTLPRDPRDYEYQAHALTEWQARRAEKRLARQIDELLDDGRPSRRRVVLGIIAVIVAFAAAIGLLAEVAVAWNTTGDDRFGWLLLLIGAGLVLWFSWVFRDDRGGR
jgi:predicted benzoate:H+ symporter BenE